MRPDPIKRDEVDVLIDATIAQFPTANREAVEQFCWNATTNPKINSDNLSRESSKFSWNIDTINVIRQVLITVKKL